MTAKDVAGGDSLRAGEREDSDAGGNPDTSLPTIDPFDNLVTRRQVLVLGASIFIINIGVACMSIVFAVIGRGTTMLSLITVNVYGAAVAAWTFTKVWRNPKWPRK